VQPLQQWNSNKYNIIYPECVSSALAIQDAMNMRHIVNGYLSGSTALTHIMSQSARLSKKFIKHKIYDFVVAPRISLISKFF
jgi:hypothetical protein